MNKKTIQVYFNHVADAYDETRIVPDFVVQKAFSIINNKIHFGEKRVILDIGVGTGRTCRSISQYGNDLIGLDISPKMLRKCLEGNRNENSVGKIKLILGDIMSLPFRSSTFDVIIGIHVFEFIGKLRARRRQKAIKEIKRVMKPRGFLIIMSYTNPPRETIIAKKYREQHRKHSARAKERLIWICKSLVPASVFEKVARAVYWRRRFGYIEKSATSVKKESIVWTQRFQTSQILNILEKRIYSDYFNTPHDSHSKIMKELKKWIKKESIGDSEEVECNLKMKIIKF